MRAIIEIFLAIIFSVAIGNTALKEIKLITILKVSNGIGSLESFTAILTKKN